MIELDLRPSWEIVAGIWATAFVIALNWGNRQRLDGGGTWARLIWVSLAAASAIAAPAAVGLFSPALASPIHTIDLAVTIFFVGIPVIAAVGQPMRFAQSQASLPLVTDQDLLERVAKIAGQMKTPTPKVRWLGSLGLMLSNGWAGGLAAPSLILSDGALARFSPAEQNAILAHEIAHIASGSLWRIAMVAPAVGILVVLAIPFLDPFACIGVGCLLYFGASRFLLRREEFLCDKLAADVVGPSTMTQTLIKLQLPAPSQTASGLEHFLAGCDAHPSMLERLDQLTLESSKPVASELQRSRWYAKLAGLVFVAYFGLVCYLGSGQRTSTLVVWGLCFFAILTPTLLTLAIYWRRLRFVRQRAEGFPWSMVGLPIVVVLLLVVGIDSLPISEVWDLDLPFPIWLLLSFLPTILMFGLFFALNQRSKTLALEGLIREKLTMRDFAAVRPLTVGKEAVLRKSHKARNNVALASLMLGDHETARREFIELSREYPKFWHPPLNLAIMTLRSAPTECLQWLDRFDAILPGDPSGYYLRVAALRNLGRREPAQTLLSKGQLAFPEDVSLILLASRLALDEGAREKSLTFVKRCEDLAPGNEFALLARLEYAVRSDQELGPAENEALAQLKRFVAANPFNTLDDDIREIVKQIETRKSAPELVASGA